MIGDAGQKRGKVAADIAGLDSLIKLQMESSDFAVGEALSLSEQPMHATNGSAPSEGTLCASVDSDAPWQTGRGRGEMIRNGELVDISSYAAPVGFVVPVALTQDIWNAFVEIRDNFPFMERSMRAKEKRLLEILLEARRAVRKANSSDSEARFHLYRLTSENERAAIGRLAIRIDLFVHCGPGDHAEPVLTVGCSKWSLSRSMRDRV